MSHDENVMPDALAGLAASACLAVSDIPFDGPISEVRVGRINGEFIINPSAQQLAESDMDIMVGASKEFVAMVEGEMDEVSEKDMADAIHFAHEAIKVQIEAQERLREKVGKTIRTYEVPQENEEVAKKIYDFCYDKCYAIAKENTTKHERSDKFDAVKEACKALFTEEELEEYDKLVSKYFSKAQKEAVRNLILNENIRLDGRNTTQIRPIWCEVGYLPSAHGSSIFTRGETQSLTTVTLGTSREANVIDLPSEQGEERFYLHYNFPPFSTGEARPLRGTSRREIGHGNLAQRALKRMIPEDCPYTVRVVSEILESNGSSSQASICGGSLSLMSAGVPIKEHVAGIAMGLIKEGEEFTVLTDIMGLEDHLGDMDFKVAGTKSGITALQMDIKITGITEEIMRIALNQAHEARIQILELMNNTISKPAELKSNVPRIQQITIPKDKIAVLIGPGGKNIKSIIDQTGATVDITDDGLVSVFAQDAEVLEKTLKLIDSFVREVEYNEVYEGRVVSIMKFGAFMEILPGKEGLLHISEISPERVEKVEDVLSVGDVFKVRVISMEGGKISLSKKKV